MRRISNLAALAISSGVFFVGSAFAQIGGNSITCAVNVAATPTAGAESFTAKVSEITLSCTGGTPTLTGTAVPAVNIQVFLNTAVTSRIYPNGLSEAMLMIDEPGSGIAGTSNTQLACNDPNAICAVTGTGTGAGTFNGSQGRPNIFPGKVSGNSVAFNSIPIDPPANGQTRVFRFVNIRANATSISGSGGI